MKNKQKLNPKEDISAQRDRVREQIDNLNAEADPDHAIGKETEDKPIRNLLDDLKKIERLMEDPE